VGYNTLEAEWRAHGDERATLNTQIKRGVQKRGTQKKEKLVNNGWAVDTNWE